MKRGLKVLASLVVLGGLALGAAAQTASAGRYDSAIQAKVVQELAKKQQFRNLQASTEDGIVTGVLHYHARDLGDAAVGDPADRLLR